MQHDVVITSYNIIATEVNLDGASSASSSSSSSSSSMKKSGSKAADDDGWAPSSSRKKGRKNQRSPLFEVDWVVLDEAHIIRDRSTRQSKAAVLLAMRAERRWCLSGTPMQNRLEDLYSLLCFLRLEPFASSHEWWTRLIAQPLRDRDSNALTRLQKLVGFVCLRRRKSDTIDGKPILVLPSKRSFYKYITLSSEEKKVYDTMVRDGKKRFDALCETNSVMQHYAFVLEMLLRLRQACCHPSLVPEKYRTGFATLSEAELGHLKQLLDHLDQSLLDAEVECCVCLTALDMPVITPCKHVFCRPCMKRLSIPSRFALFVVRRSWNPPSSNPP